MDRTSSDRKELRALVDEQSTLAEGLVRLAPYSRAEIASAIHRLRTVLLERHPYRDPRSPGKRSGLVDGRIARRLEGEHRIFVTSIEQLEWFFQIVQDEDHGGNRQALGQYWKLLLEALQRHLDDEDVLEVRLARTSGRGG
ncbi:MAG: hypothetical protein WCA77_06635 [Thermoplasmata archaeon]